METTKLSWKGQIILPEAVREAHPRQPGMNCQSRTRATAFSFVRPDMLCRPGSKMSPVASGSMDR